MQRDSNGVWFFMCSGCGARCSTGEVDYTAAVMRALRLGWAVHERWCERCGRAKR